MLCSLCTICFFFLCLYCLEARQRGAAVWIMFLQPCPCETHHSQYTRCVLVRAANDLNFLLFATRLLLASQFNVYCSARLALGVFSTNHLGFGKLSRCHMKWFPVGVVTHRNIIHILLCNFIFTVVCTMFKDILSTAHAVSNIFHPLLLKQNVFKAVISWEKALNSQFCL